MTVTIESEHYTVEAPDYYEAAKAMAVVEGLQAEREGWPSATLPGDGNITLEDLVEAWERKSSSRNYDEHARAAYCDAAEKLEALLKGGVLTESP
jgi:hypothetical protein